MTRSMSPSRRARIFEHHDGICHICGGKIDGVREKWDVEHIIPLAMTGDDSDENLAPAHKKCHGSKTKTDVHQIAKAKRVSRKHIGAVKPKRKIGDPRFKKKVSGEVVRRDDEDDMLGDWF